MLGAAGLLVLGWYVRLPEALSAWRVTHDWLNRPPNDTVILLAPARLLWSMVSVIGPWWGPRLVDKILFAAIGATVVLSLWRLNYRLFTRRRLLLWLCVAAACIGPLVFDLLRGTYVSLITRYALPGLPAVLLLAAIMLASRRIPRAARLVLL